MKLKALILSSLLVMSTGIAYANDAKTEVKSTGKEETLSKVPAEIKSALSDAKSISLRHRDLSKKQIANLEKLAGMKSPDDDFHTYIAYGTKNGRKAQISAATIIEPSGMKYVIVYNNDITIKKIMAVKGDADFTKSGFLKAFVGKDHDQDYKIGKDLKYTGAKKAAAQAFATAIKMDILTMDVLYGKPHSHSK